MAIDPLLSQATSRVAELQRGSGDEKRRQDQASSFQNRSSGAGGQAVAFDEGGRAGEAVVGGSRTEGGAQAFALSQAEGVRQEPGGQPTGGDGGRQAAALGFSAQLLGLDAAADAKSVVATGPGSSQKASEAYNSTQIRITRDAPPASQQVVTGSGMLMGFGAMDDLTKLDVTV